MHILFDTRADRPDVFRMTRDGVAAAATRAAQPGVGWALNEDPADRRPHATAEGIVTSNEILMALGLHRLRDVAPKLRWVHIIGAGVEPLLPLDWLGSEITLTNNSGVHAEKMRESGMMALLMLNARMPAIVSHQRAAEWSQIFTGRIAGKTVLIVGVGDMGGAVASAAKALGMHVLGVTRRAAPHHHVDRMVPIAALDDVLPEAEFVVLAAPLTPATHRMMDARRIGLMRPGAGLFNIGRAGLLDHDALVAALEADRLSGAILDVFDPEPLPASSPLWHARNVIMTPHVTSDDLVGYLPKTYDLVFANAGRLLRGEAPLNRVDPTLGY